MPDSTASGPAKKPEHTTTQTTKANLEETAVTPSKPQPEKHAAQTSKGGNMAPAAGVHSVKTKVPIGEPAVQTPLQQLMYGLIYPAVLGTGIVLTGVRGAHDGSFFNALLDPSIQLGFIAGLFFCASFDSAFYWPPRQSGHYSAWAFGVDFIEVVLMFICFHYLRLFELPEKPLPNLRVAYAMLAADVVLQYGWRWVVGLDWKYKGRLRGLVALALIAGSIWGDHTPAVNLVITAIVTGFVFYYVVSDPRYKKQTLKANAA
jgi:hypothetical protein